MEVLAPVALVVEHDAPAVEHGANEYRATERHADRKRQTGEAEHQKQVRRIWKLTGDEEGGDGEGTARRHRHQSHPGCPSRCARQRGRSAALDDDVVIANDLNVAVADDLLGNLAVGGFVGHNRSPEQRISSYRPIS